jgi:NAD(P)-dependent dehydrogenase (short-subunit alcohol dehydrogenase family)
MTVPVPDLPPQSARIDLSGQTAIVTGAAGGLGFGLALSLARAGATVVTADRDADAAAAAADRLMAEGYAAAGAQLDVTDEQSITAVVDAAADRHGSIDILVNNAGVSTDAITEQTTAEEWRRVIDVNLTGPFLCSKAVLPRMAAAGRGRIVNIGSLAAIRISYTHGSSYTAAKAGLLAFTRHLAYEVAGRGVTVNAVNPGPTLTPAMAERITPERLHAREIEIPAGRLTLPEDVARTVLYLVSDLADTITGQTIDVDGGAQIGWLDMDTYFERRGAGSIAPSNRTS